MFKIKVMKIICKIKPNKLNSSHHKDINFQNNALSNNPKELADKLNFHKRRLTFVKANQISFKG